MTSKTLAGTPATPPAARRALAVGRWLAWPAALAVLLGIFSLYTHPDFMVGLADKLWSCF